MHFLGVLPKYFEELSKDIEYLVRCPAEEKGKNYLIASVALRVLGGFLAFNTARSVIACFITPLSLLSSLASAIVAFVIARDLLKVGGTMRSRFEAQKVPSEGGEAEPFFNWDMSKKGEGVPEDFKETLILKNFYAFWNYAKTFNALKGMSNA
jgi:hypothetical protein